MKLIYQTERLNLILCDETYAAAVTHFVNENKDFFSPFEQLRAPSFYTQDFQAEVLKAEFQAASKGAYFRYYLFLKDTPDRVIGTVSFSELSRVTDKSCKIGYKLAKDVTGHGYAQEAILCLLLSLKESFLMHRVEADILEENLPSRKLIEKLGFQCEGIARSSHKIKDVWRDHLRYAYIFD